MGIQATFMNTEVLAQTNSCLPLVTPGPLPAGLNITGKRSYAMGFTTFPHTTTTECGDPRDINLHYIKNYGDLMVIAEDGAVPWEKAIQRIRNPNGFPTQYPEAYQQEIRENMKRRNQLSDKHKVALYVNYMNFEKTRLADNRTHDPQTGARIQTPLPQGQKFLFNHDYYVAAFVSHVSYLIDNYRPDFVGIGIENNIMLTKMVEAAATPDPNDDIPYQAWIDYVEGSKRIFNFLKAAYPQKTFYLSLSVDDYNYSRSFDFGVNNATYNLLLKAIEKTQSPFLYSRYIDSTVWQRENLKMLMPATELIAISAYPYMAHADPKNIPADYFSKIRELAPEKRFAFAETGFIAENLETFQIPGSVTGQANYIVKMLQQATTQKAVFVNWYVARDYDQMWQSLANQPGADVNRIWRDTGLFDGDGVLRLGGALWRIYLLMSYQP